MQDIDIAKKELLEKDLTLAVVKSGEIIYNSKERGVLPLYKAVTDPNCDTREAACADRVTGKGAALLCAYGQIGALDTRVISKSAAGVLEKAGIGFTFGKMVDFIKNRSGDGGCPVEALTKGIESPEAAIGPIREFLTKSGVLDD